MVSFRGLAGWATLATAMAAAAVVVTQPPGAPPPPPAEDNMNEPKPLVVPPEILAKRFAL
jgi:hypothetical protein